MSIEELAKKIMEEDKAVFERLARHDEGDTIDIRPFVEKLLQKAQERGSSPEYTQHLQETLDRMT